MTLNKAQLEAVVELAQDGFAQEALYLAQAYSEPTEVVAGSEVVAMPSAVKFVKSMLQSILIKLNIGSISKLISRVASALFSQELDKQQVKAIAMKYVKIMMLVVAIIAPILIYLVLKARGAAGGGTQQLPGGGNDPALPYIGMAQDNLAELKLAIQRLA
jgi:hypothetical protein